MSPGMLHSVDQRYHSPISAVSDYRYRSADPAVSPRV